MDNEYNLSPGEVFIMQSEAVELICGKERERLNELVLTNKNLILVNEVSTSLFTTQRMLKRCPLDGIVCQEGIPQAFLGKKKDIYILQVVFPNESVTLRFPLNEKREAKRWADAIKYAIVGDFDSIDTENALIEGEVTDLLDGFSGLVGAFISEASTAAGTISKTKQSTSKKPPRKTVAAKASAKCPGCRAPLLGAKGSVVTCEYCGTKQTL